MLKYKCLKYNNKEMCYLMSHSTHFYLWLYCIANRPTQSNTKLEIIIFIVIYFFIFFFLGGGGEFDSESGQICDAKFVFG